MTDRQLDKLLLVLESIRNEMREINEHLDKLGPVRVAPVPMPPPYWGPTAPPPAAPWTPAVPAYPTVTCETK